MKIWDEILIRLRNNEPPEIVRRDYRSDSQFAKALRIYTDELSRKAEEIGGAFRQENQKLNDIKVEHARFQAEKDELEKDVGSLREEEKALSAQVQSAKETHDLLKADVDALEKSGFTREVIEKLNQSWVKNGEEAMLVLQDLEKATALRDEVQSLGIRATALKRSIDLFERKKTEIAKKVTSEQNRLDRIKAEAAVSQKTISVVEAALRRGYTSDQLTSVFVWLERMEIQNQPGASIERLLEFFGVAKNLANLKAETIAVEKRLEELRGLEVDVKARIELWNTQCLKRLEEQDTKGTEAISSVAAQAAEEIRRILSEMLEKTRIADETLGRSMREKEKLEQLKTSLEPALALMGISPSTALAKAISPSVVILLLENVKLWFEQNYPNAVTQATYNPGTNEFTFNPFSNSMKVVTFLKYVIECLRKIMANES